MKNKIFSVILSLTTVFFSLPVYAAPPQLTAPSGLTATTISQTEIDLVWTDNSNNETGFKVARSTDGIVFNEITTTAVDVTAYADASLLAGTTYYYRVRTYKVRGNKIYYSDYSNVSFATTLSGIPDAPTNLTAILGTSTGTSTPVTLTWIDNSNNETGFTVQRSTDGINFGNFRFISTNYTTTEDLVANDATYYYRVKAVNAAGSSPYSNTVMIIVP